MGLFLNIEDTVKTIADKYENKAAFQKEYYKEHYRRIAEEGRRKRREIDEKYAQYFGVVFSSEENIRKAVNEANDAEKSILKKIIGRLKQFIAHIKATLREYAVKDKTVEAALNAEIKELEELARNFDAALTEAREKNKPATDEDGVKFSKTSDNDSIKQQISFNLKQISELDIAANINFTDISKKELLEKAISEIKQFGY